MTSRTLIKRSLCFHWRSHLGVVLGAAIGSAALIGALIVGDSVRESLRERALERLGGIHFALDAGERLFSDVLPQRFQPVPSLGGWNFVFNSNINGVVTGRIPGTTTNTIVRATSVLHALATGANEDGTARANQVNVFGITTTIAEIGGPAPPLQNEVLLNRGLAAHLHARPGDTVLLRIRKPEAMSAESPVAAGNLTVALRLKVKGIVPDEDLGNLSLRANPVPPYNAFIELRALQSALGTARRANLVLAPEVETSRTGLRLNRLQQWAGKIKINLPWNWGRPKIRSGTNAVPDANGLNVLEKKLRETLTLEDLQIEFRPLPRTNGLEVRTSRIFLDPELVFLLATNGSNYVSPRPIGVLTYLVNQFRAGGLATPYSMVTATDSPLLPADLHDDEIVINQWLADDLNAAPGTNIALTYFAPDQISQLIERTNVFRVRAVIPMSNALCDRTLMPDFPGVANAEHAGDWETSFPLVHKIRTKDDEYWQRYRGTPKAFVNLRAGQRMWANRFGYLTALRWETSARLLGGDIPNTEKSLRIAFANALRQSATNADALSPASFALQFRPVREEALRAADESQDFGGLFIGFSFFLIAAALILMGLLFAFGVQQRAAEIGTLLALGFTPKKVRRLFLLEGAVLAFLGSVIGVIGGIAYARAMLHGLTTIWKNATNTSALTFHVSPATVITGLVSGTLVALITIWLVLRRQARQPARALLAGEWRDELHESPFDSSVAKQSGTRGARPSKWKRFFSARWISWSCLVLAMATIASAYKMGETTNPEYFFSAGSLALIAGLAFTAVWLRGSRRNTRSRAAEKIRVSLSRLLRNAAGRRRSRSVATVALIASGVFLIASIGAFRLDADTNAWKRSSGTGGFALIGESTLPILKDLNAVESRDALGLDEKVLRGVSFVPFRVREGDDASCLNLNRAQQPKLLGVNSARFSKRDAFSFNQLDKDVLRFGKGCDSDCVWASLEPVRTKVPAGQIPAIGDAASIQWALHKKIGDTMTYQDEHGINFDVRLVGGLANSILQGSLIIDETEFTRRFPSVSGYRMFLIDCPSNRVQEVSAELTRAFQDYGFEVTPTAQRLAAFNAVQNTYLNTFQVLGGLGLLLGSFGLGIVVLRNVLERRGELALFIAVGFRRSRVQKLVLGEHAVLLSLGLVIGVASAMVAILPSLLSPRAELPVASLALTLGGVLLFGLISTWLATRTAVKGNLLEGLRNE